MALEFISILRDIRDRIYPEVKSAVESLHNLVVKTPVVTVPNNENGTAGDANVIYDGVTNTFEFYIPQGEKGETIFFKGEDTLENILLKSPINQNDGWQSTTNGVMPNGTAVLVDDIIVATGEQWFNIGSLKSEAGATIYKKFTFNTIVAGQLAVTLPEDLQNESVYLNGVLQVGGAGQDYLKTGLSITFALPLSDDDIVVVTGGAQTGANGNIVTYVETIDSLFTPLNPLIENTTIVSNGIDGGTFRYSSGTWSRMPLVVASPTKLWKISVSDLGVVSATEIL